MGDKYGVEQDPYCFPGTSILANRLGIKNQPDLTAAELHFTQFRADQYIPDFGDFSFSTFKQIHYCLFQDLYEWAGVVRTVDISKGRTRFANVCFVETEANKLFRQLENEHFLASTPEQIYPQRFAHYYSELNVIHPFRDGNGRAQRILFETLAIHAGYEIHWKKLNANDWIGANIAAYHCDLAPLTAQMILALIKIQ